MPQQIRAPLPTHPAAREGIVLVKRRTDRTHELPDFQRIAVAQFRRRQIIRVDLDHRDVRHVIRAHELRGKIAPVLQPHLDLIRLRQHMDIRHDIAIALDDDPAPLAPALVRRAQPLAIIPLVPAVPAFVLKKTLEPRQAAVVFIVGLSHRIDHHHARRDLFKNLHEALIDLLQKRKRPRPRPHRLTRRESRRAHQQSGRDRV